MTDSEYARWCILNIPITSAECTVFRFLFGFDPMFNQTLFERYIRRKGEQCLNS